MEVLNLTRDEAIERYEELLDEFYEYLKTKNLTQKTINLHCNRLGFYIFYYLMDYELYDYDTDLFSYSPFYIVNEHYIDNFLGNFYIRKVLSSSVSDLKGYITAFNKYIDFLEDKRLIDKNDKKVLKNGIKLYKDIWIYKMEAYDNPEYSFEDIADLFE